MRWTMADGMNEMDCGRQNKWDGLWYMNKTKME